MRNVILVVSFWLLAVSSFAKDLPSKPNPPQLVNDFAGVLSSEQKNALEQKLVAYFDSTSTQIAIVIENSLDGDDLFDYSQRLATAWGIGEKGKNNGLLIYVAINDRKVRIHTGYGMEATVTDALTTRIRQEYINPNFKKRNYYEGLDEATDIIMRAASGEYINDREKSIPGGASKFILFFIIIIILLVIFRGRGGRGGGMMMPLFFGTFGSGGFSSGGGGGSGGFGGFGGGGFGGGGSGGSW